MYAKIFSLLVLTLYTLLSAIFVVIEFCARVLICTRRLKIPSHLRTLSEFPRVSAGCLKAAGFYYIPLCTRRLKIPSHLRTLSEFLQACAGCLKIAAGIIIYQKPRIFYLRGFSDVRLNFSF